MKCTNCNKEGMKYDEQVYKDRPKKIKLSRRKALKSQSGASTRSEKPKPRTNFSASCNKCGHKGIA